MAVPPSHFPAVETWIPGVKPTSLLYANNCIPQVPDEMALPTALRPTSALIGRDFNGHVKTAVANEYPGQSLRVLRALHMPISPAPFTIELAEMSSRVEPGKDIKPDYQPHIG